MHPAGVLEVVVFADSDPKYAGQAAAYSLAHRLAIAGLSVTVKAPSTLGWDWADELHHA